MSSLTACALSGPRRRAEAASSTNLCVALARNEPKSWWGAATHAEHAHQGTVDPHDNGHDDVELTYEDPEIFVKPWKVVFPLVLAPGENLMENICENNRFPQLSGGQNP